MFFITSAGYFANGYHDGGRYTDIILIKIARGCARVNYVALSLILIPISRNSIWTILLGIPFDRMLKYHRWMGRILFFFSLLHGLFLFISYGIIGDFRRIFDPTLLSHGSNLMGLIAFSAMCVIVGYSLEPIRRKLWETFAISHSLVFLVILFTALHRVQCVYYIATGLFLYLCDLVIRIYKITKKVQIVNVRALPGQVTRIEMKKANFKFKGAQFAFLWINKLSYLQFHPFTLCYSTNDDEAFVCYIKSMGPNTYTDELYKLAFQNEESFIKSLKIAVEGPYGRLSFSPYYFKFIALISGGIGVTPMISILQEIEKHKSEKGSLNIEKIYFHWTIPEVECFDWFKEILLALKQNLNLKIIIHITRGKCENEDGIEMFPERPKYEEFFVLLKKENPNITKFGVYTCGPKSLMENVERNAFYQSTFKQSFFIHKESFHF